MRGGVQKQRAKTCQETVFLDVIDQPPLGAPALKPQQYVICPDGRPVHDIFEEVVQHAGINALMNVE